MTLVELLAAIMAIIMLFVCATMAWRHFHNVFAVLIGAVGGVFIGVVMVIVSVIVIGLCIFGWAKLTGQTELFEDPKPETVAESAEETRT